MFNLFLWLTTISGNYSLVSTWMLLLIKLKVKNLDKIDKWAKYYQLFNSRFSLHAVPKSVFLVIKTLNSRKLMKPHETVTSKCTLNVKFSFYFNFHFLLINKIQKTSKFLKCFWKCKFVMWFSLFLFEFTDDFDAEQKFVKLHY